MSSGRVVSRIALAAALAGASASSADPGREALDRGDAAWQRRGEGAAGLRAAPGPIAEAIAAYEQALAALPDDLEIRWKLARALHYQGEYVLAARGEKLETFARGRDLGEEGLDLLAAAAGGRRALAELAVKGVVEALRGRPEAAPLFYWSCVQWGLWGRETGKLAAVRQGVADKVRRYSEIVIGLDEGYESAGAHRILGRLHFEAPKVPFVTGWVNPRTALSSLERAAELAPEHPLNELYLIEALLEHERARRPEALERLRTLVKTVPRPDHPVEDALTLANARALLEEWAQ